MTSLPSVLVGLAGKRSSGANGAMARQEGGQCSIGRVRGRIAWLAGAVGAGVAVYRKLRHPSAPADNADPRAEDLRQKLEESRSIVDEREEAEAREVPVDQAPEPEAEVEDRRRAVHERGRAAADKMRGADRTE
jgi:hypothetical protein